MHERQAVIVLSVFVSTVFFTGGAFADTPKCNGLEATIVGTDSKDKIYGTSGNDVIVALGGNDIVFGKNGNDIICGGAGNDMLYGNSGNDILIGEGNLDTLDGGYGVDMCDASLDDKRVHGCETQFNEVSDNNLENLQNQLNNLQKQINEIILGIIDWSEIQGIPEELLDGDNDTFAEIKCTTDQMIKWSGTQWECFDEKTELLSTLIFFQHSSTAGGVPEWVGTTNQIFDERDSDKASFVMPFSGTLSNLMAKTGMSGQATNPGPNESIILTVIKNGIDTLLSCTISDVQTECSDTSNKINISQGDLIILRVNPSINTPLVNIRISAQLSE